MTEVPSLVDLVRSFLESAQFRVRPLGEKDNCLVADRLIFGEERDTRLVWVAPFGRRERSYEGSLLDDIRAIRGN